MPSEDEDEDEDKEDEDEDTEMDIDGVLVLRPTISEVSTRSVSSRVDEGYGEGLWEVSSSLAPQTHEKREEADEDNVDMVTDSVDRAAGNSAGGGGGSRYSRMPFSAAQKSEKAPLIMPPARFIAPWREMSFSIMRAETRLRLEWLFPRDWLSW